MFFVEFCLTKKCDQRCYYCDVNHKGFTEEVEIDLDYFKWIVDELGKETKHLMVELCGGEPGLVSNLPDIVEFLLSHKSVEKTQIMSNGLVRVKHEALIDLVDWYNEHLVMDIVGTEVKKFHDMEFLYAPHTKNVIVMTERTVNSLIENEDYFRDIIESPNFWFKTYVERGVWLSTDHVELLKDFYLKHKHVWLADHYMERLKFRDERLSVAVCAKSPFLPVIDMEDERIIHCAYHNFTDRITRNITEKNLSNLVKKSLFKYDEQPEYCKKCHHYYDDPIFLMKDNRSNR